MRHLIAIVAALLVAGASLAGDCDSGPWTDPAREVVAVRLAAPVTLDGRLDETAWQRASAAPLIQRDPENGCRPRQETEWWVAYDDEAVYVGARLHDAAPDSIVARLGRRDTWPSSDWVFLNLDTFNDDRNGYSFSVNPAGVLGDAAMYNDGWTDDSWDAVWQAATAIDQGGWNVEIKIPFSQLAFPDRPEQVWGINFSRRTLRTNGREDVIWMERGGSGYVQRFPDLVGIAGIAPSRKLEVSPYALARGEFLGTASDNPFHDGSERAAEFGADLQYGLSTNLALTATVNPDFGQVEVDPAVVNLSAFETYLPEKRPFFVKDATTFQFGSEGTSSNWGFNWMEPVLFYSRRVGRTPQVPLPDNDYAEPDGPVTILGAAKVSGKLGASHVGLLTAVTAEQSRDYLAGDLAASGIVEPATSYSALRVKNASHDGRRGVGVMATSTWRDQPTADVEDRLVRSALTAGVDGWLTLDDAGVWAVRGHLSGSRLAGSAAAIDRQQRSSRRYLQRPEADHARYDPEATHLAGWAGRVMLNKQSGSWMLNTAVGAISPGYEINDLGFQYRADVLNAHVAGGYRWMEPGRLFRFRAVNLAGYRTWDFGGRPDQYGAGAFWDLVLANYWAAGGSVFFNPDRNDWRATRGGPVMRVPAYREASVWVDTDGRKPLYLLLSADGWTDDGGGSGWRAGLDAVLRPSASLRLALGPSYRTYVDHAAWIDNVDDDLATATYGTRHVFGDLGYQEFGLTTRVDWTFTPRLTLQAYVQPLLAVGRYTGLKEFARPSSYDFAVYGRDQGSALVRQDGEITVDPDGDGPAAAFALDDPDFNFKSLRANVVLRWEWQPGSTFYLVWSHDQTDTGHPGDSDLGRDVDALLSAAGDDVVMAKVTWWLDL